MRWANLGARVRVRARVGVRIRCVGVILGLEFALSCMLGSGSKFRLDLT